MNKIDVNFLIIAYRGFSLSEGKPSEKNLQEDGISILKYVFEG